MWSPVSTRGWCSSQAQARIGENTTIHPRGRPRDYCNLTRIVSVIGHCEKLTKRRISPRKRFIGLSRNDVSRQKLCSCISRKFMSATVSAPTACEEFFCPEIMRCFIVRWARSINALGNATIPRDENAILNSVCPSSERGIGFRAAYLTRYRKSWTNHFLFYRRLEYVPQGTNNLYPFVHILPSGRIFVGEFERTVFFRLRHWHYGQGIITRHIFLTQYHSPPSKSFPTSLVLSQVPALVAHFRMKLPQHAPNTDPISVLIRGGSNFGIALDNCVSMQPDSDDATWAIERTIRLFTPGLIKITILTDRWE